MDLDDSEMTIRGGSLTTLLGRPPRVGIIAAEGWSEGSPNRRTNEDAWGVGDGVAVVADGIGGRPGGRAAADAAVASLIRQLEQPVDDWAAVLDIANETVRRASASAGFDRGSCVVAALRCRENRVTVVSLGDVRAYRLRSNTVQLLTIDHSVAGSIAELGITRAESGLPRRELDAVTSYLGDLDSWQEFSVHELTVRPGDRIVLCSDGVYRHVSVDEFAAARRTPAAGSAARHLVDAAAANGTSDDATALVVDLHAAGGHRT